MKLIIEYRATLAFIVIMFAAASLLFVDQRTPAPPTFAASEYQFDPGRPLSPPRFGRGFLNEEGKPASVHAGSITQLGNGDLLAAWFGGTREGARDVAIYTARFRPGQKEWSTPVVITDRERTATQLHRHIRKLGNPVIYAAEDGRVWLFYVTVSVGGWAGSSITVMYSDNNGGRWSRAERLVTSPFLNVSTLVKGSPISLDDGRLALPVYHEFINKRGELLILTPEGHLESRHLMTETPAAIQPWIVPGTRTHARAFYRRAGDAPPRVLTNRTSNGGTEWDYIEPTDAPNPGAGVSVIRTHDGRLLMAYNPQESNRHKLSLAISSDGLHWERVYDLENGQSEDEEYSYPYLIRGNNNDYHLIYTWNRKRMRQASFNHSWLEFQL